MELETGVLPLTQQTPPSTKSDGNCDSHGETTGRVGGWGLPGTSLLPHSLACRLGVTLSEGHWGPHRKHLPSQHDGQGPCKQRSKEAPQGVQRHDEGPHHQDQVVRRRLASPRLPRLIGEFLNMLVNRDASQPPREGTLTLGLLPTGRTKLQTAQGP